VTRTLEEEEFGRRFLRELPGLINFRAGRAKMPNEGSSSYWWLGGPLLKAVPILHNCVIGAFPIVLLSVNSFVHFQYSVKRGALLAEGVCRFRWLA